VRKVLDLEAELERLRERVDALELELARASEAFEHAVDEVHRSYRRDLVPVRAKTVVRVRPR
jgi:MerR family transcriptional regulator/heat shock protein HspR